MKSKETLIKKVTYFESGRVVPYYSEVKSMEGKFLPGRYSTSINNQTGDVIIMEAEIPEILPVLSPTRFATSLQYVKSFVDPDLKEKVEKAGYLHKGGILYVGKPGVGKTAFINSITETLIKDSGAVVLHVDPASKGAHEIIEFVEIVRELQDGLIVIVLDEFEKMLRFYTPGVMEQCMDGSGSFNNCLFLASCNSTDDIPDTFTKRPSRFKHVIEVGTLSARELIPIAKAMVKKKVLDKGVVKKIESAVDLDEQFTVDSFKHFLQDIIFSGDVNWALANNKTEQSTIGFGNTDYGNS